MLSRPCLLRLGFVLRITISTPQIERRCELSNASICIVAVTRGSGRSNAGYPENLRRKHSGTTARPVHRAYARKTKVKLPLKSHVGRRSGPAISVSPSGEKVVSICSAPTTPIVGVSSLPVFGDRITGAGARSLCGNRVRLSDRSLDRNKVSGISGTRIVRNKCGRTILGGHQCGALQEN